MFRLLMCYEIRGKMRLREKSIYNKWIGYNLLYNFINSDFIHTLWRLKLDCFVIAAASFTPEILRSYCFIKGRGNRCSMKVDQER